jgi:hypothetical protein
MTRAATVSELANLRTNNQFSKLYLAIIKPDVVFTAQVDGVPLSEDEVYTLPYYGLSYGAPGSIVYGQTVFIGSTPGGYEYGMVRAVSGSASGSLIGTISIGVTSEISWVDGAYITVLHDFGFWPKTAKMIGISMVCDDDKVYTDQHTNTAPVPVMGPDNVLRLSGSSVSMALNAASSWVPHGSSVTVSGSPTWGCVSASGSFVISGSTITFYSPATYTLSCRVATSSTAATTGHRTVYVWNDAAPPVTQFTLETLQGDWRTGGWNFDVTMYAEVDRATIHDRAKVILFSENVYGGSAINMGPLAGYESVIAVGWIDGQSMSINPEINSIRFSVHGAQWWLNKIASWPAGIRGHLNKTPVNWNEYQDLTYDAFMWHILRWRCTASEIMDIFPSLITTRMVGADAQWGTIWGQFTQYAEAKLLVHPCVNRHGQLYNQINANTMTAAARTSVPTVMEISKQDWGETLEVERRIVPEVGFMDTTGMFWNGSNAGGFRSGSWGTAVGRFGRMERRTELYIDESGGQTTLNNLAGILLGNANVEYPRVSAKLIQFNPFFDIAPNQYGTFSIEAADTPLNMLVSNKKFLPRTISYSWDSSSGMIFTDIIGEGVSNIEHGFYLPFYTGPQYNLPPPLPWNPWTPGARRIRPPSQPLCTALNAAPNGPYQLPLATQVYSGSPGIAYIQPYHCKLRDGDAAYPTVISADCTYYTASGSNWNATSGSAALMTVKAFNSSGSNILTGTQRAYSGGATGTRYFDFAPATPLEVWGFEFASPTTSTSGSALTPVGVLDYDSFSGTWYSGPPSYLSGSLIGGSYVQSGVIMLERVVYTDEIYDQFVFKVELPASPGTGRVVYNLEIITEGGTSQLDHITYPNNAGNRTRGAQCYIGGPKQDTQYTYGGVTLYGASSGSPMDYTVVDHPNTIFTIDSDSNWTPTGDMTRWIGIAFRTMDRDEVATLQLHGVYWLSGTTYTEMWVLGNDTTYARSDINSARIANVCRYFDP